MKELSGRTAFVTGGVSGIGLGIGKALARAGCRVALSYRNEQHRDAALVWFEAQGFEAPVMVRLDVTDRARFAEVADEIEGFVAAALIGEPQATGVGDFVALETDGAVEGGSTNETHVAHGVEFPGETEGARRSDFSGVAFGRHFHLELLMAD